MVPHLSNSSQGIITSSITVCTSYIHVDDALVAVPVPAWIMIRTK